MLPSPNASWLQGLTASPEATEEDLLAALNTLEDGKEIYVLSHLLMAEDDAADRILKVFSKMRWWDRETLDRIMADYLEKKRGTLLAEGKGPRLMACWGSA